MGIGKIFLPPMTDDDCSDENETMNVLKTVINVINLIVEGGSDGNESNESG